MLTEMQTFCLGNESHLHVTKQKPRQSAEKIKKKKAAMTEWGWGKKNGTAGMPGEGGVFMAFELGMQLT